MKSTAAKPYITSITGKTKARVICAALARAAQEFRSEDFAAQPAVRKTTVPFHKREYIHLWLSERVCFGQPSVFRAV